MKIIDINCQIGTIPVLGNQFTTDNLLNSMHKYEVMGAVVSSTIGNNIDFVYGNRMVSDAVSKFGEKANLLGCITVNCNFIEESLAEMRKYLYSERFVALRITAGDMRKYVTLAECEPILNSHRRYGTPVFIHAKDVDEVIEVEKMSKAFDGMRFVLLAMGEDDWKSAVIVANRRPNISLEISGNTNPEKIRYALDSLGSHRLLYGSELPYVDGSVFKSLVENTELESHEKADIYYNNARKLFEGK